MIKSRGILMVLATLLLMIAVFVLSSCGIDDSGNEITLMEVIQLPYRMVYVAGIDDSLDMEGCILLTHIRDGRVFEDSFYNLRHATVRHEIDFLTPGKYEVFLYWGEDWRIYTMVIQVVAPN